MLTLEDYTDIFLENYIGLKLNPPQEIKKEEEEEED